MGIVRKLIQQGEKRGERKGQQKTLESIMTKLEENNMGDTIVYKEIYDQLKVVLTDKKHTGGE